MFEVNDVVTLSESGIKTYSLNGWGEYPVPYAIFKEGGVVTYIGGNSVGNKEIYVKPLSGGHSVWFNEQDLKLVEAFKTKEEQYTGGSSDYYKVYVKNPTTLEEPYEAECNDIIEALKMTFAEGNAFKAIWRKAKARQGVKKKGYDNGLYDSEKVVFFGGRMVVEAKESNA